MFRVSIDIPSDGLTPDIIRMLADFENNQNVKFRFSEIQERKSNKKYVVMVPSYKVGQIVEELGPTTIKGKIIGALAEKALGFEDIATAVGKSDMSVRNALADLKQGELITAVSAK